MALVLNEDEVMMRDMAQGFFAEKAPVKALRELRDNRDETGFDRALWEIWLRKVLQALLCRKNMAVWIWAISQPD